MEVSRENFTEKFPYFRKVDRNLVNEILSASRHETISGIRQLKKEGDKLTDFVFLMSGNKRIYKISSTGREITLYEMEAGDICILNAVCLLSKSRLPANAEALGDISMLLLAADDFNRIMAKYEEMPIFVFSRISTVLASIMSLIAEITFTNVDKRLVEYLVEKSENGKIFLTHQAIANDLGTSREVVSRLLKDFERKDVVKLSRNLIELKGGLNY